MIKLNIDKGFEPFGSGIDFEVFDFPSGCEPHIKIKEINAEKALITLRIRNLNQLMLLFLATDALKRSGVKEIEVFIPYLPFARQDRVMVSGEPLSVKVISDLINLQNYSKVTIYDAHSEVSLALINNAVGIDNHSFVKEVLKDKENYLICSPDAGAYKKIFKLCQKIGYKDEIVLCNKVRDVSNGKIQNIMIANNDLQGKDLYILDDICDGGGTFTILSKELKKKNCGKVNLIVSHGIFSKGEEPLKENIDMVYTTDSFKDITSDYIKQVKLAQVF